MITPNPPTSEIIALALDIADMNTRTDIETRCRCHDDESGKGYWYDIADRDDEDYDFVAEAVDYQTKRGLLILHPTKAGFVRPTSAKA